MIEKKLNEFFPVIKSSTKFNISKSLFKLSIKFLVSISGVIFPKVTFL